MDLSYPREVRVRNKSTKKYYVSQYPFVRLQTESNFPNIPIYMLKKKPMKVYHVQITGLMQFVEILRTILSKSIIHKVIERKLKTNCIIFNINLKKNQLFDSYSNSILKKVIYEHLIFSS